MIFPIPYVKYRIIDYIYKVESVKISELLKKLNISQKAGYEYINSLLKAEIITERLEGKKPLLRILKPNLKSEAGKLSFSLIELQNKIDFLNSHKELAGAFDQFNYNLKDLIVCAVIFGSYARKAETKESDIDIAIFAQNNKISFKNKIEKISELCFSSLKNKVSIRIFDIKKLTKMDELMLQIIKNHIVIINANGWVELLSSVI